MRYIGERILLIVIVVGIFSKLEAQLTPQEAVLQMGRGINIGNSLDAVPTETSWGNQPIQEYYFDDIKLAGFKCVRIPVTWKHHTSVSSPYLIDATWLDRVDTIVTWALERDLFVILNAHHEDGVKAVNGMEDPSARADTLAKYDSIWSQVAERFKNRSEHLLFEILNEPQNMQLSTLDSLNARILSIIRKNNPTRIVLFSGTAYTGAYDLVKAAIPESTDSYLMAYYHSYDPWSFAGEANGTFGTTNDLNEADSRFKMVSEWSKTNSIPVTLNETGTVKQCDYNSRMIYYATSVEYALKYNIAINFWDDNGNFQVYDRNTRVWNDLKDVIIHTYPESPTKLKYEIIDDSAVLRWTNRTDENDSIVIESIKGNAFDTLVVLAPDADSLYLPNLEKDVYHYYRIKTTVHDTLMYSYAIRFKIITETNVFNKSALGEDILELYPNPTSNIIHIRTDVAIPNSNLIVYNVQGLVTETFPFIAGEMMLDVSDYPNGIYFIRIEGKEKQVYTTSKFVKK
ncbi:MAG: cellulase family glycosylhydrolase [Bacteroidales bacterium]|nr:cellulase family glycosylhydrolase [Bacteroidales bacterium]MBN2819646.1 cellulase family glycosylhydrolase [Bacteroidales bacterium]